MDSVYHKIIIKMLPKVLTQVDRDRNSKTYGCCDRNHWHLKTRDFSSAILQQVGLALAELYLQDFEGNILYNKTEAKEWAIATLYYWKKIQLKDGSFNEYYPNEHGFPPTAFSMFSMCEVYKKLAVKDESIEMAFDKTAHYLANHIEPKAYNQEMASITALYSYYQIKNDKWILDAVDQKLSRFLSMQSREGWFPEYGGADIGYLSVCFDMLAEYYWLSRDERVVEPLKRLLGFIQYFIHPDGTIGGEYASRNTIYFLPNGLEVMCQLGDKTAAAIKKWLYQNSDYAYFFMDSVDDRYCSHYLLNSFTRALEIEKDGVIITEEAELPFKHNFIKFFKESGLYVYSQDDIYVIVGSYKGGVIKAFYKEKEVFCDYGYRITNYKTGIGTTNWQDSSYCITQENSSLNISGNFNVVSQKVPTPILHMGLRVISKIMGNKIISFLKKQIILVDKHSEDTFHRHIEIHDGEIIIKDQINGKEALILLEPDGYSLRHVASGKFFTTSDLSTHSRNQYDVNQQITIQKRYNLKDQKWIQNEGYK